MFLVVGVAAIGGGVVVGGADPVGAQSDCETEISDQTCRLDEEPVALLVDRLRPTAQVLVRAFDQTPDGLASVVDDLIQNCLTTASGRERDYVVVAVALGERSTELRYGDEFRDELDGRFSSIMSDDMNPQFAVGDLTAGIVAGLGAIEAAIVVPATETSAPPSSSNGGLLVGGAGAGLVALAGAGTVIHRRRRLTDERNAVERLVADPLVRVGVARERSSRLVAQSDRWERLVTGRTLQVLTVQRATSAGSLADLDRAASLLSQSTPDGIGDASRSELGVARTRVAEIDVALTQAEASLDSFTGIGETIDRLAIALPAKRALLMTELDETDELVEQRRGEGWIVEPMVTVVATVRSRLNALDLSPLALDLLALSDTVETNEADLFAVRHDLQTLADRRAGLEEWAEQLALSADQESDRVGAARQSMAAVSLEHSGESWRWAADHPEQAAARISASMARRRDALVGPFAGQDWERACKELEEAGLELLAADRLLDDVDVLMVNLRTAKAEAPGLLDQVDVELRELRAFVLRNDDDLPARFDVEPDEVATTVAGLRSELASPRPNHLRVAQTADRLARRIDVLLAEATAEHERVEGLRRELSREVARARRSIDRARSAIGWELFASEDSRVIDRLENELQGIAATSDPPALLPNAVADAAGVADDAVAIRERIIARRRRHSTWVVVGSSSSWGDGGGSGSGGGGFGGGGGGGGFGGGGGGSSW